MAIPIAALGFELFAAWLAPPRCAACDARTPLLAVFCRACASTTMRPPEIDAQPFAAFVYGGAVARAIARLKYENRPDLARPLGDLLWRTLEPHAAELRGAVVVPVPLYRARLAERGFNQSTLLARRVAGRLGARLAPRALVRVRDTAPQATLDRAARMENVAAAFRARDDSRRGLRRVLLIDDVSTTGATLAACAQALFDAGAHAVSCAVVAHAARTT
jgi:ComF family protein